MSAAHDAPEYAAVRALGDLPADTMPARPAELLQRGADTMRDRQRATLERYLSDLLQVITPGSSLMRQYLVGAVIACSALDIVTAEEAKQWVDRAWEASRG